MAGPSHQGQAGTLGATGLAGRGFGFALLALAGCLTSAPRGYPLYAGPVQPAASVATLRGPIATVDSRDVSALGRSFELPIGCHVVTTRPDLFDCDSTNQGSIVGRIPSVTFAFHMKAGHTYTIQHVDQALGGVNMARVWLTARDVAPSGTVVEVPSVTGANDIAACEGGL